MESSVGQKAYAPQPEHRIRPEVRVGAAHWLRVSQCANSNPESENACSAQTNKEKGQSKYQRAKEALAQEATAISDELERLQQAIEVDESPGPVIQN